MHAISVLEPDLLTIAKCATTPQKKTLAERKKCGTKTGWREATLALALYDLYGFDLARDVVPDLMHAAGNVIRDLARATVDMLQRCNLHVWCDVILKDFKRDLPPAFCQGRRIPWDLSHTAITSWSAEECLIWVRFVWRLLFAELRLSHTSTGAVVPPLLDAVQHLWELLESALLPLLDQRGLDPQKIGEVREGFVMLLHGMQETRLNGEPVLSLMYMTQTFHSLLHLPSFVEWWGNLTEHWCFVFERMAGLMTTTLRGYNHRGRHTGVGAWLSNRMMLSAVSRQHGFESVASSGTEGAECIITDVVYSYRCN